MMLEVVIGILVIVGVLSFIIWVDGASSSGASNSLQPTAKPGPRREVSIEEALFNAHADHHEQQIRRRQRHRVNERILRAQIEEFKRTHYPPSRWGPRSPSEIMNPGSKRKRR